jgi:ubiquinone/menaquinone biosynthesis C-methylase UbiE
MKLNVGCGGNKYPFYDLKCEVNCDIQRPKIKISNFVLCDARYLPFKDKTFQGVYAFNVLEHINDYMKALKELNRVSNYEVLIRLDKPYNLANWFTSDHETFALGNILIAFPKPIKCLIRIIRFPIDNSEFFRKVVHETFPLLRKMKLLDRWNYYKLK